MELRTFLAALVSEGQTVPKIPAVLRQLARQSLPPSQRQDAAVDDLLGGLLLHLLEGTRRGNARSVTHLLVLDDAALIGALRRRLRQVQAEAHPRRSILKALASHVRAALRAPIATSAMPLSLTDGDRFSASRVSEAVGCLVGEGHGRKLTEIVAELMRRFFPDDVPDPERALATREQDPQQLRLFDAPRVAAQIRHHLGDTGTAVVAMRAQGLALHAIAMHEGMSISSVHAEVHKASRRLRKKHYGRTSLETFRAALEQIED